MVLLCLSTFLSTLAHCASTSLFCIVSSSRLHACAARARGWSLAVRLSGVSGGKGDGFYLCVRLVAVPQVATVLLDQHRTKHRTTCVHAVHDAYALRVSRVALPDLAMPTHGRLRALFKDGEGGHNAHCTRNHSSTHHPLTHSHLVFSATSHSLPQTRQQHNNPPSTKQTCLLRSALTSVRRTRASECSSTARWRSSPTSRVTARPPLMSPSPTLSASSVMPPRTRCVLTQLSPPHTHLQAPLCAPCSPPGCTALLHSSHRLRHISFKIGTPDCCCTSSACPSTRAPAQLLHICSTREFFELRTLILH
jgi:hypothetical protein